MLAPGYLEQQRIGWSERALASILLARGQVTVRPAQQSDVVLIQDMHRRLSKESVYYRYLVSRTPDREALQSLCFCGRPVRSGSCSNGAGAAGKDSCHGLLRC